MFYVQKQLIFADIILIGKTICTCFIMHRSANRNLSPAMLPCSSAFQRAYTVANALNNIGVTLIERRFYKQALEVLQDAVEVMKEVSASLSIIHDNFAIDHHSIPQCYSIDLNMMIERANRHLSACYGGLNSGNPSKMRFLILSEHESAVVVSAALKHEDDFYAPDKIYLIRMEQHGQVETTDVDLECSQILFNYASAFMCMSVSRPMLDSKTSYHQAALKLFRLSFSLLSRNFGDNVVDGTIPMAILLLRSLIIVATQLDEPDEHVDYYISHMVEVQQIFLQMDCLLLSPYSLPAAAA